MCHPVTVSAHREIAFEEDICAHLAAHGWYYDPAEARHCDRGRALFPPDLIA
jgi:type I restriction enzyme R subunit